MRKELLAIITVILLAGCTITNVVSLNSSEVRDYQGEDLSSINDFRENSIKGPQYVNIDNYTLSVKGLVNNSLELTYDEVLNNYQAYSKVITLYCVEGWTAKILWEGVLLKDLISEAGALPEANTVVFTAYDGYTSSIPLDYVINNDILLAYKMNNVVLPPERGYPFQVVAEDKWGYKWVKWVTNIILTDNPDYEGFWESRGYSDTGDLDEPFFD
ncbi:MAG: molybdopterin-dependent oxidoreductase [Nanoarchaeota archaeon]|nr:molybdopterin-dependent oxidoreductase [Nanoarchaeota archaeon]